MQTSLIRGLRAGVLLALGLLAASCASVTAAPAGRKPHNIVLIVADGLRYGSVNRTDTPALAAIKAEGVDFANPHALFPTITTVNASAIATGHYIGDTGDWGNTIWPGNPVFPDASYQRVIPLEDDAMLRDMNARFGGNYLHETSLLAAARAAGFSVAALGKTGPTAIQDVTSFDGKGAVVIDDVTGFLPEAPKLDPEIAAAIKASGLGAGPPARMRPNNLQVDWYTSVISKVLLPRFKAKGAPFMLVYWSADPDNTQHGQNDSPDKLVPGVNGPTSKAAIKALSDGVAHIRAALKAEGLDKTTDIFVTADHGFSTVAKDSQTSATAKMDLRGAEPGQIVQGYVGVDLAKALALPLSQSNGLGVNLADRFGPPQGSVTLGGDFEHPDVIVGANGGADLIWLPGANAKDLAPKIVNFLTTQDYVAAIFVNDDLGKIPGALAMSAVGLKGAALTPAPSIYVSLRSYATGCAQPVMCAAEVADTEWEVGGGIHGALSRADTRNFMAATGPDFKRRFVDAAPVSNADIAPTLAKIMGIDLPSIGMLKGRVIAEGLAGGRAMAYSAGARASRPAANGFVTTLDFQQVGATEYYDAAGAPARTVGMK